MDEKVQLIDDEEIITLFDEDDKPMDFYEIAVVEYEGELYALLQPAEEIEGIADDEVVIFKIEETEGEEDDFFYPVEDEAIQEAVFEEFLRATSDAECGGECEGCASSEDCSIKD
ncbi:MAG: DUF1292 domain-containing protein [Clostridia bacterium]|nr:DUF1292 domain-containing protein [Clostridia bacterium]